MEHVAVEEGRKERKKKEIERKAVGERKKNKIVILLLQKEIRVSSLPFDYLSGFYFLNCFLILQPGQTEKNRASLARCRLTC